MPTLAKQIVDEQASVSSDQKINFKGFAVGNPFTTPYSGYVRCLFSSNSQTLSFSKKKTPILQNVVIVRYFSLVLTPPLLSVASQPA